MNTTRTFNRGIALALASAVSGFSVSLGAASVGYRQTSLVSDQAGMARFMDAELLNPWGLLAGPGGRLVVADNHAGVVTFYTLAGRPASAKIVIPVPGGNSGGAVTDLGVNRRAKSFVIQGGGHSQASTMVFVTEDGTIAGWNRKVNPGEAVVAVDNSAAGAIYKSMTLVSNRHGPRLFAANFGQGVVEMYDAAFHRVNSFTDTELANAGYVPFGMRAIGGRLFVTFALKASPGDGDETAGPGLGYVDEFDMGGALVRRFASQGTLNAPWGLALAPRNFGKFGGALLVGNFGDGAINAFNLRTGELLGQLSDAQGNSIHIEGLWGLTFGPGGAFLYFSAGPGDEEHGLLGAIRPVRPGMGGGY